MFLLMQSCRKHHEQVSKQYTIDTTLASGIDYQLNLQPYGDADDIAVISKQGSYFSTSEIINTAGIFAPVYHYSAITKASLTDQVVLTVKEGNSRNGSNRQHCDSTTITINFTIK